MTRAPEAIETPRLRLRRPRAIDAPGIFERYASDPDVARYLGRPRHQSIDDTRGFLEFSEAEWARGPAGPYLAFLHDGSLVGAESLYGRTD
jgi:RimJ/RimL family protein N-acetyltransferase